MEKRIDLEKRGKPAEEIEDLNLDNCRATQLEGLSDDFKNLRFLSLVNVGLTTLKGFPNLPNLRKLDLSDNRISGSLNFLSGCEKLTYLNLSGNRIENTETLEPLKEFPLLRGLDLFNCEITNLDNYRKKVFELIPSLEYQDGFDKDDQEVDFDDEDDDVPDPQYDEIDDEDEDENEYNESDYENINGEDDEYDEDDDDDDDDDDDSDDGLQNGSARYRMENSTEIVRGQKRKHDDIDIEND